MASKQLNNIRHSKKIFQNHREQGGQDKEGDRCSENKKRNAKCGSERVDEQIHGELYKLAK